MDLLDSKLFWLIVIIFIIELFRIQFFYIENRRLIIKRRLYSIKINFEDIIKIEEINIHKTFFFLRIFGVNSGLWNKIGLFGIFWNRKYGLVHFYLKRRSNVLMIFLKNKKKILISPNDETKEKLLSIFK